MTRSASAQRAFLSTPLSSRRPRTPLWRNNPARPGPRLGLAPQAAITGDQRSFRQRRYVGAVEKRDLVRDVEKMTLARKREPRVRVQIGHRDPPSFSRVMTRPERSGKASNEQSFFLHSPEARGALSKQLNYLIA